MLALDGVLTAIVTPFARASAGHVDLGVLDELVERQVAAGAGGLVPCGTTGEFHAMTDEERRGVVARCADRAGGRLAVVPQTGAPTTARTVELSRHAATCGAAAVLVMPPTFSPVAGDALRRHLDAVVAAAGVPVVLYLNPAATGVALSAAQVVALCRDTGIAHVKYTSPDVSGLVDLLLTDAIELQVLPAWDHLVLTALATGARATIWGAAAAVPELCVALFAAGLDGDHAEVHRLWLRAAPLFSVFARLGYVAAVKAVLELQGVPVGPPRLPTPALGDDQVAEVRAVLAEAS